MTPFEREYGVPDLPGGWPGCVFDLKFELDEAALRQKLDVVKDGHATVISDELATSDFDSINRGDEEDLAVDMDRDRDIRVTKLVVHPIKVSHQSSSHTAYNLRLSSPFAYRAKSQLI